MSTQLQPITNLQQTGPSLEFVFSDNPKKGVLNKVK